MYKYIHMCYRLFLVFLQCSHGSTYTRSSIVMRIANCKSLLLAIWMRERIVRKRSNNKALLFSCVGGFIHSTIWNLSSILFCSQMLSLSLTHTHYIWFRSVLLQHDAHRSTWISRLMHLSILTSSLSLLGAFLRLRLDGISPRTIPDLSSPPPTHLYTAHSFVRNF